MFLINGSITFTPFHFDKETNLNRKFVHTREELLLTRKVTPEIQSPGCMCRANLTQDLVMVVHSAARTEGEYFARRQMSRETWGKDAREKNVQVIFAIGLPLPSDPDTQLELIQEQAEYGDMVQFQFIDDYYNLTLKAIAITNWLHQHCSMMKFIVKMDDDLFVNMDRLLEMLPKFNSGITGHIYSGDIPPDRDPTSRYYIPISVFPDSVYPRSVSGLFYVMSSDVLEPMSRMASTWSEIVLDIDDVYMTGIVAEALQVTRTKSSEMVFRHVDSGCNVEVEELFSLIAFHGCASSRDYQELYWRWKNSLDQREYNRRFRQSLTKILLVIVVMVDVLIVTILICQLFGCQRRIKHLFQATLRRIGVTHNRISNI